MKYIDGISCASMQISVLSGVGAGKFLGYLITNQGTEVNPDEIEAVKRLKLLRNLKEVQVLTGMLAALNQFISKYADHYRPFYQLLKKWRGFSGVRNVKKLSKT